MATRYHADVVVTVDAEDRVLQPGVVDVEGDRIVWVGTASTARWDPEDGVSEEVHVGGLLMPGLVNTHAHSAMTLLRGAGDGLTLDRWLQEVIWPQEAHLEPDDIYWGALLGFHELLSCGVTTSCEMYLQDDAVVEAAVDAGIRCVVTPGILDLPGGKPERRWPAFLEAAESLHATANGRGTRITIGLGPHSAYVLPPEALTAVAEVAQRLEALVHVHVAETEAEGHVVRGRHGCGAPEALRRAGLLEGPCLAAHSVWLDDDEIELFRHHEVAVAHCPGSNGKLGSGVVRLGDLLAAGVTVGLGTDGPASNDDLDLWQELRLAPLLARATTGQAGVVTTAQALALATRRGADALRLPTGAIEAGRLADFVRLELDDDRFVPALDPAQLMAHLVWAADRSLVTDVWVGGRPVVRRGRSPHIDPVAVRRQVTRRAARLRQATR